MPDIIRYYRNEEPILQVMSRPIVWTIPRSSPTSLDDLGDYVVKPVDGSGGKGIVIGPQADGKTLASPFGKEVVANPRGFIAQRPVALSTLPTYVDGKLAPRHVDLRPFAINDGRDVWVLPGV